MENKENIILIDNEKTIHNRIVFLLLKYLVY